MIEAHVLWRATTWAREAEGTGGEAAEVLGADLPRWNALQKSNPVLADRMLAGRSAVRAIVQDGELFPWRGFAPSTPGRKPRFLDGVGDFSVAHSGEFLLIAVVAHGSVGVDVEVHESAFDNEALARRVCTPSELRQAAELDPEARRRWLTLLWTAKEAIAKLRGSGLRQDFRRLEVGRRLPRRIAGSPAVTIAAAPGAGERGYRMHHPELDLVPAPSP